MYQLQSPVTEWGVQGAYTRRCMLFPNDILESHMDTQPVRGAITIHSSCTQKHVTLGSGKLTGEVGAAQSTSLRGVRAPQKAPVEISAG